MKQSSPHPGQESLHSLRHTFAVHFLEGGAAVTDLQGVLGHADLSTTQRYMHLSPAATEDAIRLLDGREYGVHGVEEFGDILDTGSAEGQRQAENPA